MENKNFSEIFNDIKKNLSIYLERKFTWYTLIGFEKVARLVTILTSNLIIFLFFLISLMFFSVGGAWMIGKHYGSVEIGFFVVGGIYLLFMFILMIFRKRIFSSFVIQVLASIFFKDEDEDSTDKRF
ncbi:MAG: hypothetical protein ACOCW7_04005 [Bacteroidota bacterium]